MRKTNYDKKPFTDVHEIKGEAFAGYSDICAELNSKISKLNKNKTVIIIDCYPGVIDTELLPAFVSGLKPVMTVNTLDANNSCEKVLNLIKRDLTDDRVRGFMSNYTIDEFFDDEKIKAFQNKIHLLEKGIILIYGVGASLISKGDITVYADMARWEIQLRYRTKDISNWCSDNFGEDPLRMYKRAFFVDWRVADRHKKHIFNQVDYFLDTNKKLDPKMITASAMSEGLKKTARKPFRVVPYFDEAPWGGQWMKEICDLERTKPNYGWCFDCVPEENSLLLKYDDIIFETPSINLVFFYPVDLLGNKVHARFGCEFPIRFDFLDTMNGGHLSLQVHPTTEYIQEKFGMHYTQDESYYMLDTGDDACVYLGTKTGINKDEMINDLEKAQDGEIIFNAEKYVNKIPAKKHDHFLIPGGTVHCSGANSMVLEISATPYIFTFKLWDWERVGLDGKPRPIHIDHGKNVINWNWNTEVINKNHVNCFEKIEDGIGWSEGKTGLHDREFIETRRHWFSVPVLHNTDGLVNVLNLIEGDEVIVESPSDEFEPFTVHYAETFIIPALVGEYTIKPYGKSVGEECATLKAYVRV
ncbi:MAG TPA: class I mannose-6-phosphate isomerase [Victivallales bacterium]|nr:class I mannose-6-phosphate isomerase [Victivallales bacterium]